MKKIALCILFVIAFFRLNAQYQLHEAYPGLQFEAPVDLVSFTDAGNKKIFVVSQPGRIYAFSDDSLVADASLLLDISSKVMAGGERGLLGLALHPDFSANGYFFVNYTRAEDGATVIARYQVSDTNPDTAFASSEQILLVVPQPASNHNGGALAFGPDGYLYIALGDGGGAGDPQNNAQNKANLLGAILRIDVNSVSQGLAYAIPIDNPFAGNTSGYREEIYAFGLRNPWKMSFDPGSGSLWAADVGQNVLEEVNIIRAGANYGWRIMEGSTCFNPPANCDTSGLVLPVWEYTHASGAGRSVTGGYVYRGSNLPALQGKYIYGDYVSGKIWALSYEEGQETSNELLLQHTGNISSFGLDNQQELLVCSYQQGKIYRLGNPLVTSAQKPLLKEEPQIYPQPSSGDFILHWETGYFSRHKLTMRIVDITGREVAVPILNKPILQGSIKEHIHLHNVLSGMYLYELEIDGQVVAWGKFILNK